MHAAYNIDCRIVAQRLVKRTGKDICQRIMRQPIKARHGYVRGGSVADHTIVDMQMPDIAVHYGSVSVGSVPVGSSASSSSVGGQICSRSFSNSASCPGDL